MKFVLPPLNTLRLFEAAGRHLNFKLAAQELGITPSAISHGVQALEDWLGSALFHRSGRSLSLTSAGDAYLPAVTDALRLLTYAADQAACRNAGSTLHVSAPPTFASKIILPLLRSFRERHPQLAVTIDTAYWIVELSHHGPDIAIRRGDGRWPGLSAERLLTETLVPVCSPLLLERLGEAATFESAPLIHFNRDWQTWADACGVVIDFEKGLKVDTVEMATEAAVQGLGIAIGRRPVIDSELASGQLVRFRDKEVVSKSGFWLVALPEAMKRPDVQAFRDWLCEELLSFRAHSELDDPVPFSREIPGKLS